MCPNWGLFQVKEPCDQMFIVERGIVAVNANFRIVSRFTSSSVIGEDVLFKAGAVQDCTRLMTSD